MKSGERIAFIDFDTCSGGDLKADELEKYFTVEYYPMLEGEQLIDAVKDKTAIICNRAKITKQVIDSCPRLKYLGAIATGYNNFDLAYARDRGIPVTNVPAYSTASVAQLVFSFMLYHCQNTHAFISDVRAGKWKKGSPLPNFNYPITELQGKTLGILGYGNIGKRVAQIATAFGMQVIISTRTQPQKCPYESVNADKLFEKSDFVSIHCPLTDKTAGLVDKRKLSLMKPSAVIINTARGGVINQADLAACLKNKGIAAAYIDVLETEPMAENSVLSGIDNCYITPHVAWCAIEARKRLMAGVQQNFFAFLKGEPQNVVN